MKYGKHLFALGIAACTVMFADNIQRKDDDFSLSLYGFDRLKPGMTCTDAETIVGKPDFVKLRENYKENIYVMPGDSVNTYKFVELRCNRNNVLTKGVYEKPVAK